MSKLKLEGICAALQKKVKNSTKLSQAVPLPPRDELENKSSKVGTYGYNLW